MKKFILGLPNQESAEQFAYNYFFLTGVGKMQTQQIFLPLIFTLNKLRSGLKSITENTKMNISIEEKIPSNDKSKKYSHPIVNTLNSILHSKNNLFWSQEQTWVEISNQQYVSFVYQCAYFFKNMGLKKGDTACLCLDNSWKWIAIEMSLQLNGVVVIGIEK